ncbi:HYDIN protein, partial [Grantiella picta]|nr:HYDIN protein [Grantiella picta]
SPEKKETKSTEKETKSAKKKTKSPEKKGKTKKGKNKIQKKRKIKIGKELKIRLRKELKIKLQKELNMKIGKELINKFLKNLKLKIRKKPKIKIRMEEEIKIPKKEVTIPRDIRAEMEKNLMVRFQIYESSRHNVRQVFSHWDRVQGVVQVPVNQREDKTPSPTKFRGQKNTVKPQEKVEKSVGKHESRSILKSSHLEKHRKGAEGAARAHRVGVPCVNVRVTDPEDMMRRILASGKLPAAEKMMTSLGIHPFGAPLPPTATFSLMEYPEKRWDYAKDSSAKGRPEMRKEASKEKSPQESQISTQSTGSPWDISGAKSKHLSVAKKSTPQTSSLIARWKRCRWIVPPHGEVKLTVHFRTTEPGLFKRVLMFEVMGSKRQYKLPCFGTGLYPSISEDPRLVFPQWRKTMKDDEIIFREYVESTKLFHFGPLLCGKSREWYVLPASKQAS